MPKDYIKKYSKERKLWNVAIVVISLVLAFWINFFVLDSTDFWKNLKASILDINNVWDFADLYIEESSFNTLYIKPSKLMQIPTVVSVGLTYNPEALEITEIWTNIWSASLLWERWVWNDTIIINLNWMHDVWPDDILLEIAFTKKETTTQLNMINANFTDANWDSYMLSTQGITF